MKKFENFKAALVNLNDIFSYKEPYGNVEIAGMKFVLNNHGRR